MRQILIQVVDEYRILRWNQDPKYLVLSVRFIIVSTWQSHLASEVLVGLGRLEGLVRLGTSAKDQSMLSLP